MARPLTLGVFVFGGVEMDDVGSGPPIPQDRRYGQDDMWYATERLVDLGVVADQLGYDSYWLTEHHFQYEGYEVVPNGLLVGTPEEVAAELSFHRDLTGMGYLTIFPNFPGDTYKKTEEQLQRFIEEVAPLVA